MNTKQAAAYLTENGHAINYRTLTNKRYKSGQGLPQNMPKHSKVGGLVSYSKQDLDAFLAGEPIHTPRRCSNCGVVS